MSDRSGPDRLELHKQLKEAILGAFSGASQIVAVESYRPGYFPYPARITIETKTGIRTTCVLKVSRHLDKIAHEARVLQALTDLGLPVPRVLALPLEFDQENQPSAALLLSELPGYTLPWLGLTDLNSANRTCYLIQEAVDFMHSSTPRVREHLIAADIPSVTLESELQAIIDRAGPWFEVPVFAVAAELVQSALPSVQSPLVFSNGDYNPLNFLHVDQAITCWVDFEAARFEDPYIGFAKFILWADDDYGWGAEMKAGLVERYLYAHDVAPTAFLPRLVLRGLALLQNYDPTRPPSHMLRVIENAVSRLSADSRIC